VLKLRFATSWTTAAFLFAFSGLSHSQKPNSILFSDVHSFPDDSGFTVYYSYRIPFSNLVFEKKGTSYDANFRILVEVTDSSKKFITRQITERNLIAKDFDQANSREIFYEGLINFHLLPETYFLNPVFTDINSGRETKLEPIYLPLSDRGDFLKGMITTAAEFSCNDKSFHALSNFNENLPFGESEYDFVLPSADTSISEIHVLMINNADTVFNGTAESRLSSPINFFECGGRILVSGAKGENGNKPLKLFTLKNHSGNLSEGILTILVSETPFESNSKPERVYNGRVSWYNKPLSLLKPEPAIKMLKYIEGDSLINALLSKKEEEYPGLLFDYWKKFDPTPGTAFNPLMFEYYNRLDYAQKNFSTITGTKGMDSDRGMVFIKFGKPTRIERTSDEHGKIVETWSYEKLQKKFVFVDRQGTGEFLLRNG
jgi:GWxTD domain-containing protein